MKNPLPFSGVITALITPFFKGEVDYPSLKKLITSQLDGGIQGFVVNGTTGESPTLELEEVEKVFAFVKSEVAAQVPLILGTGSNSTTKTIAMSQLANKWGAEAALVVTPYYNKPPQRGLVQHFTAVAEKAGVPIILYNVPSRTVTSLSLETIVQLSKTPGIVGIKEASGDIEFGRRLKTNVSNEFLLSSGDDGTCLDFILAGGHGVIAVVSHLIPRELRQLADRARQGDTKVTAEYARYKELIRTIYLEANPIPIKMALYMKGIIRSPEVRSPLVELASEFKKEMEKFLP